MAAAKKKKGAAGLGQLRQKAAQAQANADGVQAAPSGDYLDDITAAIQQETAFMRRPDKAYDFKTKIDFLGKEREFYWTSAGAGMAGNYIQELAEGDIGGLFVGLVFFRCVDPETGDQLFTDKAFKERLSKDPDLSNFVQALGAQIFESDVTSKERIEAKVIAAKKK